MIPKEKKMPTNEEFFIKSGNHYITISYEELRKENPKDIILKARIPSKLKEICEKSKKYVGRDIIAQSCKNPQLVLIRF